MLIVKAGAGCAALILSFCILCVQEDAHAAMSSAAFSSSIAQSATSESSNSDNVSRDKSSLEITPEGVLALSTAGKAYLLVDADSDRSCAPSSGAVRVIYYTRTPAFRSAQLLALRDRNAAPDALEPSQRLTGTPLDWERLKLSIGQPFELADPTPLTPQQLAQAIRDEVDIQIIDLRPLLSAEQQGITEFADSLRILPDQLSAESRKLSKKRWTVVVDGAGAISRNAAEELQVQGFRLAGYLAGGYSAWAVAKDRDLGPSIPQVCTKP